MGANSVVDSELEVRGALGGGGGGGAGGEGL